MDIKCALCSCFIGEENNTLEHVIPNAIGGRKKISGFICKKCNNKTGEKWDSALAKQMSQLCLLLNISRERKEVPKQIFKTESGEQIWMHADGSLSQCKPEFREEKTESGVKVKISARDEKEARKMFDGVAKKYRDSAHLVGTPELTKNTRYLNEPVDVAIQFGGPDAGRSVVKSALALVVDAGISFEQCDEALDYLLNEKANACFGYYNHFDPIIERPRGIPFHCIYVKGCSKNKNIIGYVELFGYQRLLVRLSSSYSGDTFENSYAINPVNGEQLDLKIKLNVTNETVLDCYDYKLFSCEILSDAFSGIMSNLMETNLNRELDKAVKSAIEHGFENCGAEPGAYLTDEQKDKLFSLIWEKFEPFILNNMSVGRRRDI